MNPIVDIVLLLLRLYSWILLARASISWIPNLTPTTRRCRCFTR